MTSCESSALLSEPWNWEYAWPSSVSASGGSDQVWGWGQGGVRRTVREEACRTCQIAWNRAEERRDSPMVVNVWLSVGGKWWVSRVLGAPGRHPGGLYTCALSHRLLWQQSISTSSAVACE
jgi:hypothetical protein